VVGNKKVAGEIRNGKYDSLTQIFKANANTYLKRDKTFTTRTSQKIDDQSKKKVPIGGGSAGVSQTPAEAEHDFKSVKRGDEDAALDSKLGSFFNKFRRK
jgi:hypothetical protein